MHMVNKPSLVHNSHCSEWCCEKQLQDLNLCSNVTSEQIWQMDYLNMWASNHRVQSSNPSDTGSAKHTAELRDKDPNHDKSVHSSTTALSRLKRVILARWVCQRSERDLKLTRLRTLCTVFLSEHIQQCSYHLIWTAAPVSWQTYYHKAATATLKKKNESFKSAAISSWKIKNCK